MPRSAEMPLIATSFLSVIARDHHVVLVLGEKRDGHQPEAAVDGDEDRRASPRRTSAL